LNFSGFFKEDKVQSKNFIDNKNQFSEMKFNEMNAFEVKGYKEILY
jgi:predicted NUDIX family phosphoesterase